MKIRPILFNTDMVRAILDGRKRFTRRIIKLPKYIKKQDNGLYTLFTEGTCYENQHLEEIIKYIKPPYQPGDILYVRETWCFNPNIKEYYYKANRNNGVEAPYGLKWHPSIHMPKEAARIWLKVKDVRVERLQDITEEQAYHEGIMKGHDDYSERDYWYYKENQDYLTGEEWKDSARQCFLWGLWDSTLKKSDLGLYDFNANPWVWVIEFERCEKPEVENA